MNTFYFTDLVWASVKFEVKFKRTALRDGCNIFTEKYYLSFIEAQLPAVLNSPSPNNPVQGRHRTAPPPPAAPSFLTNVVP